MDAPASTATLALPAHGAAANAGAPGPAPAPASVPAPAAAPAASPQRLAVLNTALAVAQALIVAYFGYALTGRLDAALKERQTELQERQALVANLEKMDKLLRSINDADVDDLERSRAVAQLSMFGSDAVFPLFVMAVGRSKVSPANALWGLRVLSLRRHDEVCALLTDADRVPQLVNEIRKDAVRELAGELACAATAGGAR